MSCSDLPGHSAGVGEKAWLLAGRCPAVMVLSPGSGCESRSSARGVGNPGFIQSAFRVFWHRLPTRSKRARELVMESTPVSS